MTPDISHYPSLKLTGKVVHELPEAGKNSCRGCSFDVYVEVVDDYVCTAMDTKDEDLLVCGDKDIVYVRPVKKHIMAYITAKVSS
jgi:hypothetical protein